MSWADWTFLAVMFALPPAMIIAGAIFVRGAEPRRQPRKGEPR